MNEPKPSGFNVWCNDVLTQQLEHQFAVKHRAWLGNFNGICWKWLNRLYRTGQNSWQAARILQRAHKIFIKK